jgi:hypothetical protein
MTEPWEITETERNDENDIEKKVTELRCDGVTE